MSKTYNGGIKLKFSKTVNNSTVTKTIDTVQNYGVSWETESESFEKYDFSICTIYKGDRFTASITTGATDETELSQLRYFLLHTAGREFTMYCPEFPETQNGGGIDVRLTSLSQPLEAANYGRKFYRLSFSVAAVGLQNGGGL